MENKSRTTTIDSVTSSLKLEDNFVSSENLMQRTRKRNNKLDILTLLLWKNIITRKRHWLLTTFEILLPTILFVLLVVLRVIDDSIFMPQYINQTTTFHPAKESDLRFLLCSKYGVWIGGECIPAPTEFPGDRKIFYGPPNNFTTALIEEMARKIDFPLKDIQNVSSNEEMNNVVDKSYLEANDSYAAFYIGVFFNLKDLSSNLPPSELNYDLRLQGFETQMYPYPPYIQDNGVSQLFGSTIPTFIMLSFVLLVPSLINGIVHEKETGIKELMRLMGLNNWLVWFGWFIHGFMVVIVVCSFIVIMLKVEMIETAAGPLPPIIIHSDGFLLWILLILFGIASIAFCFFLACFFDNPTLATTLGVLIWLMSSLIPKNLMDNLYDNLGLAPKLVSCLMPNMCVVWAFRIIAMFEGRSIGVHWNNLWETGNPRDQLTMGMILLMLIFDTFLFFCLTWYLDQIIPGQYGVPKSWNFPFKKSFWCRKRRDSEINVEFFGEEDSQNFEAEPTGLSAGIRIRNLSKVFKSKGERKVAIDNATFTCYQGQCTALLGHNGAGKTTTMSVLTGVYPASGGTAEVNGWDINTHLKEARSDMGLCPQHNTLFPDLTVREHLIFFAKLKGLCWREAEIQADFLLRKLQLTDKKACHGNQLSGGMKRKLCLANALIGESKVVILDEPSSGLDPESRRWVWDVIQKERGKRTFLITTHHMEEADVLGDRVAIMASGKVICAGSTLFLKHRFGDGYTLTLTVSQTANISGITAMVQGVLPEARLKSALGGEITFRLPPDTGEFAVLLDQLSSCKQNGITHMGLSLTTMEQVFLRVGELSDPTYADVQRTAVIENLSHNTKETSKLASVVNEEETPDFGSTCKLQEVKENDRLLGWPLLQMRLTALFLKRLIYSKRKLSLILIQAVIPVVITLICLFVDSTFDQFNLQEPKLELSLNLYEYSQSYVEADEGTQDLKENYINTFYAPYSVSETNNVTKSLLEESQADLTRYRENCITSAAFRETGKKQTMRILYQSIPFHTPPVGINLIDNALLNSIWLLNDGRSTGSSFLYSMVMPIALAFLSTSFLVFPLQERETKAKQIQVMTGTPASALWLTSMVWDSFVYLLSVIAIFMCFMLFDSKGFFTVDGAPGALFLLLFLYGWSAIPMAYVFSFPFSTAASGFAVLAIVNIIDALFVGTATWALDASNSTVMALVSDVIGYIASVIPAYPLSKGIMNIVDLSTYNAQCNIIQPFYIDSLCQNLFLFMQSSPYMPCCSQCELLPDVPCFEKLGYLAWHKLGLGQCLAWLAFDGFLFLVILWLIETKVFFLLENVCCGLFNTLFKSSSTPLITDPYDFIEDEDVESEKLLVEEMLNAKNPSVSLLVSRLSKTFGKSTASAVNNLSFQIQKGECLGLLGVNGAGKTTTFRMLTGDEEVTAGTAKIGSADLLWNKKQFVQEIGYCPQYDAILGELTAKNMLHLMASLRGVPACHQKALVQHLIKYLDLSECASRPSGTYSGGNKRKLSTAVALLARPSLVFLDEPTSGVDPAARRRVWAAIRAARTAGQSILLTSHSMDECEALCSRVAIMAKGKIHCIGSTRHLKTKYGKGYSLQLKLSSKALDNTCKSETTYENEVRKLHSYLISRLPGSLLADQHRGMLVFHVPSSISWASLFNTMEGIKTSWPYSLIEDYAASDTSLEQVFLSFARQENYSFPSTVFVTQL